MGRSAEQSMISRMYIARKAEASNYPRRNSASDHFLKLFPVKPNNYICFDSLEDGNEIEIKMTKPDVLSSPIQAKPDVLYPPLQNKPLSFSLPAVYKHLFGECGVWSVECRV